MALISKYSKSKWLKKQDVDALTDEQRNTVIESIEEDEVGNDIKPVCYFRGIRKGWPMNVTALKVLAKMTGSQDTDNFIGAAVEVYVDPTVEYGGEQIGGIKLRPLPARTAKATGTDDAAPFDDNIPF